jgi:glycine/D-amino acid oxidase-like deaminating enzyme
MKNKISKEAKELHELAQLPPPIPRPVKPKRTYVFVLDFTDGRVYRYSGWSPDNESVEDFLTFLDHSTSNCEWMVTSEKNILKYD